MQGDKQATGYLDAPESREQAMMNTGTRTQVPSHWVERTFLKWCGRTLPTPTRPRPSHCPASAGALQFAACTRAAVRLPGNHCQNSTGKVAAARQRHLVMQFIQAGGVARPRAWGSRLRPFQGARQPAMGLTPQTQTLSQKRSHPAVAPAPGAAPARRRLSLSTHSVLAW